MKVMVFAVALGIAGMSGIAYADPGKDKGRWRGGYERLDRYAYEEDRKVKFFTRDGCEVKRKWKKGGYEEKIKCKPGRYGYRD